MQHPRSLPEASRLAGQPGARFIAGGTDLVLEARQKPRSETPLISLRRIPELAGVRSLRDRLVIGGACSIERLLPDIESRWPTFGEVLRRFGSPQIRNLATLGGNLATASPIGDAMPPLLALDARIELFGGDHRREVAAAAFIDGYRRTALRPSEAIAAIHIPIPAIRSKFAAWKVSKRYDQDIATLSAAFRVDFGADGRPVAARAAFGGMRDRPFRAAGVESAMLEGNYDRAGQMLAEDADPVSDLRGSARYRLLAARGLLRRFELAMLGGREPTLQDL